MFFVSGLVIPPISARQVTSLYYRNNIDNFIPPGGSGFSPTSQLQTYRGPHKDIFVKYIKLTDAENQTIPVFAFSKNNKENNATHISFFTKTYLSLSEDGSYKYYTATNLSGVSEYLSPEEELRTVAKEKTTIIYLNLSNPDIQKMRRFQTESNTTKPFNAETLNFITPEIVNGNNEKVSTMSFSGLQFYSGCDDSVWKRGDTITGRVYFTNYNSRIGYRIQGYIFFRLLDYYTSWIQEAESVIYVNFYLFPYMQIHFDIPLTTPSQRSVGYKKLTFSFSGYINGISTHLNLGDLGYNFIQTFSDADIGTPRKYYTWEDPFELSDMFHWSDRRIITKAAAAVDTTETNPTIHRIGEILVSWVYNHFRYTEYPLTRNMSAPDTWIVSHTGDDGKYFGVCQEYATLYVSFARALHIPARWVHIKIQYYDHYVILKTDTHAIAEIWNGTSWVHADPT